MDVKEWFAKAELAIDYLKTSEEEYARYRGLMKAIPAREKIVLARLMLESPETSATAKKMWAEASPEYEKIVDESQEIQTECDLIHARRERADKTFEMWRSLNSAMKQGNIT